MKHYTSKLSTYADLERLETFGFRGEALSSLCALSRFSVTTCLASDAPKGSKLEFETSGKLRGTSVVAAQKGTTVLVEGLFQNLPVRRRELERNIKREWNRVLGVLNQYACIQVGLKFSVSQQPNKGKRMVLFSTKGNQTTRENIVNVFGAKTLAVLIPLDLELELEPTTTSGQRPAMRDVGQVNPIRVRGHVSRPAHGEGRQTPDRQMFFVNGRPCGLPQFAKVFNEVYKSYNASQSPFIFADIQLDTHLYDVNVSPDKRTILLHEQTRMLDNLREALSALFASQDYALPTSQIQTTKQSLLKRPSLGPSDTPLLQTNPKRPALFDSGLPDKSTSVETEQGTGSGDAEITDGNDSRDVREGGLVSRWAEQKCRLREGNRLKDNKAIEEISERDDGSEVEAESSPPPSDREEELPVNEESTEASHRAADFRARLEELKGRKSNETMSNPTLTKNTMSEPLIPALAPPSRITDLNPSKPYPSSAAKRTAPEVATITIGDQTVTSIIGSLPKRQRLDEQPSQERSTRKSASMKAPVPSFNGRLTQMFAAQAERSRTSEKGITIATNTQDDSEDSDSTSEHLFVSDGSEDESDNEPSVEAPNEDDVRRTPQIGSRASKTGFEEEAEIEPASPAPKSVRDDSDGEFEAKEETEASEAGDEVETAEIVENTDNRKETVSDESQKRTQGFVKGSTKKKDATHLLQQTLRIDGNMIRDTLATQQKQISRSSSSVKAKMETDRLDADDAEEKLSLTISKSDFEKMKIIGQFNLGFILASRAAERNDRDDELFIIDQHATDEKYNFERLQASTVVQSQRLVHPKTLELTAVEEDIVQQNIDALETNGFTVSFDDSGDEPVGSRCQLLSLPLSRETTFSLADLEELISLLQEHQSASAKTVPRPSKVRKMFAMRACRSSVMIGKSLSTKQMERLVRHMGELDKPWNCPHGRPTMRHLCGLGAWDELGWREGDGLDGNRPEPIRWGAYLRGN